MPFAATHIISTVSFFDSIKSKYFSKLALEGSFAFYAAIGSLLPDIDLPLGQFLRYLNLELSHGTLTHTLLFAFIFASFAVIFRFVKKDKISQIFLIFTCGIVAHLFLDYFLGGGAKEGVTWFYPIITTPYKIHLLSAIPSDNTFESLDALVLLYFFYKKTPILFR